MFKKKKAQAAKGLLLYSSIQDIISAHAVMQKAGMEVSLVPPPVEIAVGCDLAIQFDLAEEELLRKMIHQGLILPGKIHSVAEPLPAVDNLVSFTEIVPGYLMAASHNIKVTVDLSNHEIVNVSGGGCPDIPYVAGEIVGKNLGACPEPVDTGSSLCTYMIQLALDGLRREVKRCSR